MSKNLKQRPTDSKERSVKSEVWERIGKAQKYSKYPIEPKSPKDITPSNTTVNYEMYTSTDEDKSVVSSKFRSCDNINWAFWMQESQLNESQRDNFEHILTIQDETGNVVHELTFSDEDYYEAFLDIVQKCRKCQQTHPVTTPTIHYATSHSNIQRAAPGSNNGASHDMQTAMDSLPAEHKISAVLNQLVSKFDTLIATGQSVEHYYTEIAEKLRQLLPTPLEVATRNTQQLQAEQLRAGLENSLQTLHKPKEMEMEVETKLDFHRECSVQCGTQHSDCSTQCTFNDAETVETVTSNAAKEQDTDSGDLITWQCTAKVPKRLKPPTKHTKKPATVASDEHCPGKVRMGLAPKLQPAKHVEFAEIVSPSPVETIALPEHISELMEFCGDDNTVNAPMPKISFTCSAEKLQEQHKPAMDLELQTMEAATAAWQEVGFPNINQTENEDREKQIWSTDFDMSPQFVVIPTPEVQASEPKLAAPKAQPSRTKFNASKPQLSNPHTNNNKTAKASAIKTPKSSTTRLQKKLPKERTPAAREALPKPDKKRPPTISTPKASTTLLQDLEENNNASTDAQDLSFDYSALFSRLQKEIQSFAAEQSLLKAQKLALGYLLRSAELQLSQKSEETIVQGKRSAMRMNSHNFSQTSSTVLAPSSKADELSKRASSTTTNTDSSFERTLTNAMSSEKSRSPSSTCDTIPDVLSSATYICDNPMVLTVFKSLENIDSVMPAAMPNPTVVCAEAVEASEAPKTAEHCENLIDVTPLDCKRFDEGIERNEFLGGQRYPRFENKLHLDTISEHSLEELNPNESPDEPQLKSVIQSSSSIPQTGPIPVAATTTTTTSSSTHEIGNNISRAEPAPSVSATNTAKATSSCGHHSESNTISTVSDRTYDLETQTTTPTASEVPREEPIKCEQPKSPLSIDQEYIRKRVMKLFQERKIVRHLPKSKHRSTSHKQQEQMLTEPLAHKEIAEHPTEQQLASVFKEQPNLHTHNSAHVRSNYKHKRPEVIEHQAQKHVSFGPKCRVYDQDYMLSLIAGSDKKLLVEEIMEQVRMKLKDKIRMVTLPTYAYPEDTKNKNKTLLRPPNHGRGDALNGKVTHLGKHKRYIARDKTYSGDDEASGSSRKGIFKNLKRKTSVSAEQVRLAMPTQREVSTSQHVIDDKQPITNFLLDKPCLKENRPACQKQQQLAKINAKFFSEENCTDNVPAVADAATQTNANTFPKQHQSSSESSSDNGAVLRKCPAMTQLAQRTHNSDDSAEHNQHSSFVPSECAQSTSLLAQSSSKSLAMPQSTAAHVSATRESSKRTRYREAQSQQYLPQHSHVLLSSISEPSKPATPMCAYSNMPSNAPAEHTPLLHDATPSMSDNKMLSLRVKNIILKLFQERLLRAAHQHLTSNS